jgi:hypothetical protein
MQAILSYIRKEEWSPYLAGGLLGLVGILAVVLSNSLLGASGSFENVAGMLGKALTPSLFNNLYFNFIMPPGLNWQLLLLVGVFFGGTLGALSAGTWKLRWVPERQWTAVFGPSRWKRWAVAFVGAIVLEIGAGIAGGCTSGLAISGGMLLAPAAFIFIAGMFVSGIVTSLLVYRGRY